MTAIAHFFRCELSDCAILNDYTLCRHINEGEMKRRFRGRPRDYAVAVAVSALALLISLLFRPVFESNPFLLFFVAVAASTSIGGLGPGIVTILFAVVAVEVFFFTGGRSTDTVLLDLIRLTAFVLAALFIASIHQRLERSRRELARATSKRDAILRGISDGVIAVDDAHIVTLVSPSAAILTGWHDTDAIGRPLTEVLTLVDTRNRQPVRWPVGSTTRSEAILRSRDDDERLVEWAITPAHDPLARITRYVVVLRDVTKQRADADRFRRTRETLEALVRHSPLAILVFDAEGTIELWSPAAEQMYGWTASEIIGQPIPTIGPNQREAFDAAIAEVRQGGVIVNRPMTRLRKDGSEIDVSFSSAGLPDDTGQIRRIIAISSDISEARRTQSALQAANQRLTDILESISDAFFAVDHNWHFTYVNRRAEVIWNKAREALLGQHIWEVFPEAVGSEAQIQQALAMQDRQPRHFEAKSAVTHSWISVSVFPTESGISVYFRDIQAQKQQEINRDFLVRATATLAASLDYETTLANLASLATPTIADWCAIDILTEDEDIQRLAVAHIDPEKVAWAYRLQEENPVDVNAPTGVPAVLRSGTPEFYPLITDEMIAAAAQTPRDREILDQIGFRSLITVPLVARGRNIGAITLVTTTDSGRLYTEADLQLALDLGQRAGLAVDNARLYYDAQRHRQELLVTLTSIGDAVIATDAEARVTFLNPIAEALTGWSAAEANGEPLATVFHIVNEDSRAVVESPAEKVLRDGKIVGLANHTVLLARDGREVPIDDSGAPMRDAKGEVSGVVLVFRDITERRAVEQARAELLKHEQIARRNAEAANELKLKFLAMVSHELRTPLTSIKGFTSTLLASDVGWDEDTQREFLTIMDEEADRLADLVEQLLDVSRLQAGTLRIDLAAQTLGNALAGVMAQISALSAGHNLILDVPDDLPTLTIDSQRIGQVLVNLVGNAVKFSPAGSSITLSARQRGDVVQVDVHDQGEGISLEERQAVFEAFRQGARKAGRQPGAGLGLAICKGIIDAHHGDLWIEDRPGPGTTISFTLPITL